MTIPLPDGTRAPISNGQVTTAEKSLGVWSAIDGIDSKHIEENVTGKTANWINRMRNAYFPARLGWIAYRFKLWAGIRYGIATLAIPLAESRRILQTKNFQCLSFLGINRNVERMANLAPGLRRYWPVQLFRRTNYRDDKYAHSTIWCRNHPRKEDHCIPRGVATGDRLCR